MKRVLGLRSKVVLTFFFAVLGCMIMLGAACQMALRPLVVWDSRRQMESCLAEIEVTRTEGYKGKRLEKICSDIYDKELINFVFFEKNEDGKYTQFSSQKYNTVFQKGIQKAFKEYRQSGIDPYVVERMDEDNLVKRLYFIKKLDASHYILMSKSIKGLEQLVRLVTAFIMISGIVIAVIGSILWVCLTRSFMMQIIKISRVTKDISELHFDQKLNFGGQDEVGVLAESVDELSDKLKTSMEEMQRELERRKTLIRNLTHELRTPLTTIQGYAENLQLALQDEKRERRFCDIILEECEAMERLVKEMLELSRLEKGENVYTKENMDVEEVFRSVRRQSAAAFSQADICFQSVPQAVYANRLLLERVVMNYLKNAVQYGRPEGKIWVTGNMEGAEYVISVTNEGCSLSAEDLRHIWEAFYKTDRSRKRGGGYGIGLAIVQEIAHIHGARADVCCREDKTTFLFRLPVKA